MSRQMFCVLIPLLLASALQRPVISQTAPNACPAPPAILTSTQPNIFSEQQEQWLGDAMADMVESEYRPVKDPAENEYLTHIASRLLAALPPTRIQFRVILVDSPEVNGFSLAGGRVYLTRKLVANAKNEDEVASVIAHEMGHILSHQFAVEFTADFKRLLNVTGLGDKADVYAKFQRLVDAGMKDKHPSRSGNSDEGQDEADTVAVYATAAAGYRPQAYSEFWDRMFFVDGKVGGALSDFFHTTKPESRRLRSILKLVNALPSGCGSSEPTAGQDFERWHSLVVANQPAKYDLDFKTVSEVALSPALRMDLERLRFSPDGKYMLAQDPASISVLSREPFKQLFRFNAEDALPAQFTPDSQDIVFHTPGLHIEEWSIQDEKLVASYDPLSRYDCVQSKISPDGKTIFCLSPREKVLAAALGEARVTLDLSVIDTASGQILLQKKDIYTPDPYSLRAIAMGRRFSVPVDVVPGSFSSDGNTLLIGVSSAKLAFDLQKREPITLGKTLKDNIPGDYAFLGNEKLVGNIFQSGFEGIVTETDIFSFPDGKKLGKVPQQVQNLDTTSSGNYVIAHTSNGYGAAIADLASGDLVFASKTSAIDFWNDFALSENMYGGIVLHDVDGAAKDQAISLLLGPMARGLVTIGSSDGKYLAMSTRTRGGVWNLSTGQRVMVSRGFVSGMFTQDDSFYAEFPKLDQQQRGIARFTLEPFALQSLPYKEGDDSYLDDGMLQEWKLSGKKDAQLIAHGLADNSVLWTRTYASAEPAHTLNLVPDQMIFSFPLTGDSGKELLASTATLNAKAETIKNKDAGRIIQLVDSLSGKVLNELVIEVPLTYEGVSGINIVGPNLYLTSEDNRTMVYSLATGAQLRQIFGYVVALDVATGRICTVNRRDEATVYDPEGNQVATFRTGSPLRFATFQQGGNRLVLLTADQKVRTMEIAAAVANTKAPNPAAVGTPQ